MLFTQVNQLLQGNKVNRNYTRLGIVFLFQTLVTIKGPSIDPNLALRSVSLTTTISDMKWRHHNLSSRMRPPTYYRDLAGNRLSVDPSDDAQRVY